MPPSYLKPGLVLRRDGINESAAVIDLQRDLRALGYLRAGIDGAFGAGTEKAVRAVQYDLLHNTGGSAGKDGQAPLAVTSFNQNPAGAPQVTTVTGILDQALAECLDRMVASSDFVKLPSSPDPAGANRIALAEIANLQSTLAPSPFIAAITIQESDGQHFHVPTGGDQDTFVTLGLDHNNTLAPDAVTSRGYGIGQYTLFHHPPQAGEVADFILDPRRNVQKAYSELREKFNGFVAGPADTADDRKAEHPLLALRLCRFPPGDTRYMADCWTCATQARKLDISSGTPVYAGASLTYQSTQYYPSASYTGVPDRAEFLCDWPYAVRRYNGSGINSYHYQTRILLNLLKPAPKPAGS